MFNVAYMLIWSCIAPHYTTSLKVFLPGNLVKLSAYKCLSSSGASLSIDAEDYTVRLVEGDGRSGVVEVAFNGRWGTICEDSYWDVEDAAAVCDQLGLDSDSDSEPTVILDRCIVTLRLRYIRTLSNSLRQHIHTPRLNLQPWAKGPVPLRYLEEVYSWAVFYASAMICIMLATWTHTYMHMYIAYTVLTVSRCSHIG